LRDVPEAPVVVPIKDFGEQYADRVRRLAVGLDDSPIKLKAIEIIQSMIDHIVATPLINDFAVDLYGELGTAMEVVTEKVKLPDINGLGSSA